MDSRPIADRLSSAIGGIPSDSLNAVQTYALQALKRSLMKKYVEGDEPTADQCSQALKKFLSCQRHLSAMDFSELSSTYIFGRVKATLRRFLTLDDVCGDSYSLMYNYQSARDVGPGANVGASTYDLYGKLFCAPLTSSNRFLIDLYRSSLHASQRPAEALRSRRYGERLCFSRLSYVKKTSDVARVICTEPTCNMLAQKAIGAYLERCLAENCGISLSRQPDRNKRLACRGSIDGRWATIDLESASDTISLELCEALLPRGLLNACLRARSSRTVLPDGRRVRLKMISSMGNAFTFPLQTIIFSAICHTVREISLGRFVDARGKIFVFGDDMVVPSKDFDTVTSVLRMFGFIPNMEKSFATGSFRESCGGDYFRGVDVRGVYLKSLRSQHALHHAFNALRGWSLKHQISLMPLLLVLRRAMRRPCYVPIGSPSTEGLWSTREQARRYGLCIRHSDLNDPSVYVYRRLVAVRKAWVSELIYVNPDGLIIAISSGRIASSPRWKALLVPKPGLAKRLNVVQWKRRLHHTSVWPSTSNWHDVALWSENHRRALAAHGLTA